MPRYILYIYILIHSIDFLQQGDLSKLTVYLVKLSNYQYLLFKMLFTIFFI